MRAGSSRHWLTRYRALLVATDFAMASIAVTTAYLGRFQPATGRLSPSGDLLAAVLLPIAWIALVGLAKGYESRFVGGGAAEFDRVFRAFLHLAVITAFVSYATKAEIARGFILVALPLTFVLSCCARGVARRRLRLARARGESMVPVLAVGGVAAIADFAAYLRQDLQAGLSVVGACVPTPLDPNHEPHDLGRVGVPLVGDVDGIVEAARACGATSVTVLAGEITAEKLRWISWQLEGTEIDLIVSPGLVEVGGRRLHIQPAANLPLLYVDQPEFTGFRRVLKNGFDRAVAFLALTLLAPALAAIAVAVRVSSAGPAIFRQVRVGRNGELFTIWKFRSMYCGAEQQARELREHNELDGPMFKMRADPRITPVGRVLRKFSLDELPQLVNVLTGAMSLVGPRPPLPSEVAEYVDDVRRRLLVKPGITGLWQVSGRSDLSWEDTVRLDLRYVENWSLMTDLSILWKTAFAVVRGAGAY